MPHAPRLVPSPLVPEGFHGLTFVDVIDLGMVEDQWGKKPKLQFVLESPYCFLKDDEDKKVILQSDAKGEFIPLCLWPRKVNNSYHSRGNAAKTAQKAMGRDFTVEEVSSVDPSKLFDWDDLIGLCVYCIVSHNESSDGRVYANISEMKRPIPEGDKDYHELSGAYRRPEKYNKDVFDEAIEARLQGGE